MHPNTRLFILESNFKRRTKAEYSAMNRQQLLGSLYSFIAHYGKLRNAAAALKVENDYLRRLFILTCAKKGYPTKKRTVKQMRICPRCLSVYATSKAQYCPFDGNRTFDTASKEAEEAVKQLVTKIARKN
jgi:predicted Zn-ribbon and HTH transcriptional regulator